MSVVAQHGDVEQSICMPGRETYEPLRVWVAAGLLVRFGREQGLPMVTFQDAVLQLRSCAWCTLRPLGRPSSFRQLVQLDRMWPDAPISGTPVTHPVVFTSGHVALYRSLSIGLHCQHPLCIVHCYTPADHIQ